jgi:L-fuconolactonase
MIRIDAHQHFWKYNREEYPWIGDDMDVIRHDFLPEDLQEVQQKAGFTNSIAVQARQSLEETKWLLQLSEEHEYIAGIVGWVDLCSPVVGQQLNKFSEYGKLVGVRHVVHDEADDQFMLRNDFLQGIEHVGSFGYTYDFLIFPGHLETAFEVAKTFPDQKFVIDHLAKPAIRKSKLSPWKKDIEKIAALPNVYCKASGMVTEADWNHWDYKTFVPYLDVVFGAFGDQRVMAGSDWPVCLVAGSYSSVMQLTEQYLDAHPNLNKNRVLGENCKEFYLSGANKPLGV